MKLDALESAFASIEEIGKYEETFNAGNVEVTVRSLTDREQVEIWKYASVALEQGADDAATQQEWMHRMKVATLSFAIVQIGETDLREEFIETGEVLEKSNKPVRREKAEIVRQILSNFGSPVILRLFVRYGHFVARMEERAEKAIQFDPLDYDAEIERLLDRVEELKKRKETEEASKVDPLGKKIRDTLFVSQQTLGSHREMAQEAVGRGRSPLEPVEEAPQEEESLEEVPQYTHTQVQQALRRPAEPPRPSKIDPGSSFIDASDPEVMEQLNAQQAQLLAAKQRQVEEHNRRLAEQNQSPRTAEQNQRTAELEGRRRHEGIAPVPMRSGRRPPHVEALQAQETIAESQEAMLVGTAAVRGQEVPVYKMPPQTLSGRGKPAQQNNPPENPAVNQRQGGGVNPKFTPPRG